MERYLKYLSTSSSSFSSSLVVAAQGEGEGGDKQMRVRREYKALYKGGEVGWEASHTRTLGKEEEETSSSSSSSINISS